MKRALSLALAAILALSACSTIRESRVNPFNWFGGSTKTERVEVNLVKKPDPRPLIATVTALSVDRYSTGAIIRATGLPQTQGWYDADLVLVETDDPSHLVFDFRLKPPVGAMPVGTARSREVTAAATVSANKLEQVRRITVQGASDARSTNR